MIITVAKHNYLSSNLLRNWRGEMPGLSVWVMPTVVRAELSRHLLVSPVTGARVTWAVADTVIIINATQCRAFSHLRLRSKSPGQWDQKKTVLTAEQVTYVAEIWWGHYLVFRAFTDSSQCRYKLRITCSVTPQINYYWILMFPHGVN